jgi:hypothetical protein
VPIDDPLQEQAVIGRRVGEFRIAARWIDARLGDEHGGPPVHSADVREQVTHPPVGAGRDRRTRSGAFGGRDEPAALLGQPVDVLGDLHR